MLNESRTERELLTMPGDERHPFSMLRAGFLICLLLAGCSANEAELDAVEQHLSQQLEQLHAVAQGLNDQRRILAVLEQRLAEGKAGPLPVRVQPPSVASAPPPMPEQSMFEGSGGARRRDRITLLQGRIRELRIVLGEIDKIEARIRELEQQLQALPAH